MTVPAPDHDAPVTLDELRTLARISRLTIPPEREATILSELNAQLVFVHMLDDVLADAEASSLEPYDPTFPKVFIPVEAPE